MSRPSDFVVLDLFQHPVAIAVVHDGNITMLYEVLLEVLPTASMTG